MVQVSRKKSFKTRNLRKFDPWKKLAGETHIKELKRGLKNQICLNCRTKGNIRYIVNNKPFCNFECFNEWEKKKKEEKRLDLILHIVKKHRCGKYENWLSWDLFDLEELHRRQHQN